MTTLAILLLVLAALPAALLVLNTWAYRPLPAADSPSPESRRSAPTPSLSILIPARNEEASIADALAPLLAQSIPGSSFEVLVLDDHSTDRTADIVAGIAAGDDRVRLIAGAPLPAGWCGKQHACWQLARAARHDLLVFLDADVRLAPDALARVVRYFADQPNLALASGVPRQLTGTWLEHLLIPLIHTVLLGYLPIPAARQFGWTAFAAGCGQWFIARRSAYFAAGGHHEIRSSLHDGIQLPRAFRRRHLRTDVFDATDTASCRMYHTSAEVWRGLGKNATEGLAHPVAIGPWTVLLLGGHVLPILALPLATTLPMPEETLGLFTVAAALPWAGRLLCGWRFRQDWRGILLHPLGVALLVVIQWAALFRHWQRRPQEWRGRRYPAGPAPATHTPLLP